jgi:hypothetical protein
MANANANNNRMDVDANAGRNGGDGLVQDILEQFQLTHDRRSKKKPERPSQPATAENQEAAASGAANPAPPQSMADMLKRRNTVVIFQTQYTKQPLTAANYAFVKRTMKMLLLAQNTIQEAEEERHLLGENGQEGQVNQVQPTCVNWVTGILDSDVRGLALIPDDQTSKNWIQTKVLTLEHDGTKFRAWGIDETPAEYCYELYLSDDYNCMDDDQAINLLFRFNPGLPVDDYTIDSVTDMADKREVNKGRLFSLKVGASFHDYCKNKNYALKYAGDMVSCIEVEEKTRQNNKKKAANAQNRQGASKPTGAGGYNKKPRT